MSDSTNDSKKRRRRKPSDLTSLLVDDEAQADSSAEANDAETKVDDPLANLLGGKKGRKREQRPSSTKDDDPLAALIGKSRKRKKTDTPKTEEKASEANNAPLVFPEGMEAYISPDLWNKLNSDKPRRGILVNGLDQLRSILYLLSTYMPNHLVQEKMNNPVPGLVKGEQLNGSLLFSDVSGFTALSERLAVLGPEGAEQLTKIMNEYFTAMLEILSWSGGILIKFAGDATLVYFPHRNDDDQANWATRAAQRMLMAMSQFANIETPTETVMLRMKIGVATGEFMAASVGSPKRTEYGILGDVVGRTMGAEGAATAGELIVDKATAVALDDTFTYHELKDDRFCRVELSDDVQVDDFEIAATQRRRRSTVPWDATPHDVVKEMDLAMRQIGALSPYLAPELVERIVARARERRFESEYRPTTVIFCNVIGMEEMLAEWGFHGIARLTQIFSAYFTAVQEAVARYGGIISRIDPYSKGTKILILFGAPIAHEDDPVRAVNAAMAMNVELADLNARWRKRYARYLTPGTEDEPIIQHRIGVTQGTTFAGAIGSSTRREYTVMGDDVNLSARLMGAADPGQILISKSVYDDIGEFFVATPLTPIRVKGKSQPIPIYQVDGAREDTLSRRARSRDELIARDEEWQVCQQMLDKLWAGSGNMLTIQGVAGIGKSHLADKMLYLAMQEDNQVVFSLCRAYTSKTAYVGWINIMRSLMHISLHDPSETHLPKLEAFLDDLDLLEDDYLYPLGELMGLTRFLPPRTESSDSLEALNHPRKPQVVSRRRSKLSLWNLIDDPDTDVSAGEKMSAGDLTKLQDAVWGVLSTLSEESPIVLFFEDAHWLDSESHMLADSLYERLESHPVFILLAQRGEDEEIAHVGELLTLQPLTQPGTTDLVMHTLGNLTDLIYEQSQGNPLFIEEIMRWLRRTNRINVDDLQSSLRIADMFQELVLSRLDNLPEHQREIAKIASIIGNEFSHDEVKTLLPRSIEPSTLAGHLHELVEAQLLIQLESGDNGRYAYEQTLVHDVLYDTLPFTQRRELHAKMATYLEAHPHDNWMQHTDMVAHHYKLAQYWQPLCTFLEQMAQYAQVQGAFVQAKSYYEEMLAALDMLPNDEKTTGLRHKALEGQGDMAVLTADFATAVAAYETLQKDLSDNETTSRLLRKLALPLPTQDRVADAESIMRQVIEMETAVTLPTAITMAWILWRQNKREASEWLVRSQTRIKQNDTNEQYTAPINALITDMLGAWETAQTHYADLQLTDGVAISTIRLGDHYLGNDDIEQAQSYYQQAHQLWQGINNQDGMVLAQYRLAEIQWRTNKKENAKKTLNNIIDLLNDCSPELQQVGHKTTRAALRAVTGKRKTWPSLDWQSLDDTFRISLIFQPEQN